MKDPSTSPERRRPWLPREESLVMDKKDGLFHAKVTVRGSVVEGTSKDLDELVEGLRDQLEDSINEP